MPSLASRCEKIAETLKANEQTVAVAESSTGGLIAASLLAVPGASAYFLGGSVIYTYEAREKVLGIPGDVVRGMTPLSEEYVALCAKTMREKLNATWGIAELGATGPAGTRYGHPPGICVLAIDGPVSLSRRLETGSDDREGNMWRFVEEIFDMMQEALN